MNEHVALCAISPETRAIVARLRAAMATIPRWQDIGPAAARRMRDQGTGPFPAPQRSSRAVDQFIERSAGPLRLRRIDPMGKCRGVYLHIHGGGWVLGAADQQDAALVALADRSGYACVSVDYRLAPEHPFPAPVDDCVAAAHWLSANAGATFGTEQLAIGGESAGAHLAVLTLLRLRDEVGVQPFVGANLVSGFFDLTLTPSARLFGEDGPVLRTSDCSDFAAAFLGTADPANAALSPLQARLEGLPAALFTIGDTDPLLDDSLFLHARWRAAGNPAELAVYPGGVHGFMLFPSAIATMAFERIVDFLNSLPTPKVPQPT